MPRPQRMAELPQRLGFDLADPLASNGKDLADFFKSAFGAIVQAKPHPDYGFLAGGERLQQASHPLLQVEFDGRVGGRNKCFVLDQVSQARLAVLPNGRLQRHGPLSNRFGAVHFLDADLQAPGDLLWSRLAA